LARLLIVSANKYPDPRADELLAIRCQLGERDAFDALIARWYEPLWRYLRTLANSSEVADDLAQDTWLRVLRSIASLRDASRLRPWIFGIARRACDSGMRIPPRTSRRRTPWPRPRTMPLSHRTSPRCSPGSMRCP
jgi:DNA-directed RNA polymerase specialized sigma24 family protein